MPATITKQAQRAKREQEIAESERAAAEAELATAKAKKEQRLIEAHGDIIPPTQWFPYDDDWYRSSPSIRTHTQIRDRQDGRLIPIYETESDLHRIRASARNVSAFTSTSIGAMEALSNYVMGGEWKYAVEPKEGKELPDGILDSIEEVVNEFLEDHGFIEADECIRPMPDEIHERSREDGEVFLALHPKQNGRIKACFVEPEQVTEPKNTRELEDWLDDTDLVPGASTEFVNHWLFGIHTREDPDMHCHDVANAIGYHVVYDQTGSDWDYIPHQRMVHIKRNVGRNAKRGISDYFAIQNDIEREAKLKGNTAEGAAVQAAIAFIREHVHGASMSGIQTSVNNASITEVRTPRNSAVGGGERKLRVEQFKPGTIKDIPQGMKYHAGPLGSIQSPIFIEVAQYLKRSIGVRWVMPEYMISGDASNANFASTLVAESPFVKAREGDQSDYKRCFRSLIWKVIGLAIDIGRLELGMGVRELRKVIHVVIDAESPASRDKLAMAQTNQILNTSGILSKRTWAGEAGLDYDQEREHISEEPTTLPTDPTAAAAIQGALESVNLRQLELGYP